MTRTSVYPPILYRSIVFGLVAFLSFPYSAAAQNEGADEKEKEEQVVVLNVHTTTTTTTAGNASAGGLIVLIENFGLMEALGFNRRDSSTASLENEVFAAAGPTTETMDYVVYIRPEEFRLEAQGFTMTWRSGEVVFTDPRTGKRAPIDLNMVNSEVAGDRIHHDGMDITPMPGAQTKGVAGYLTRGYEYSYTMAVGSEKQAAARVEVKGEAWIAGSLPEGEQVATFYRKFASAFGDQQSMMGGQTAGMARLAEIGVPLETTDTSSVYMMTVDESGEIVPLQVRKTVSTTTVTSISTVPLSELEAEAEAEPPPDDLEVPGGQPPDEPEPCDCSCEAFEKLKELSESDPNAMGKAMCAQQCMSKWVPACINETIVGGGD